MRRRLSPAGPPPAALRGSTRAAGLIFVVCATTWLAAQGGRGEQGGRGASPEKGESPDKKEQIPPPLEVYMGRRIAPTMSYLGAPWLVRESRAREENPELLLKSLKLGPGQTVCDIGCGNGFHSLKLAGLVGPEGRVLAVDIQPEMLKLLKSRAAKAGIKNVKPVLGTVVDPKLPKGQVDLVLMVDVYHEFSHPEQMLANIRAALAPKGRVALVEFRAEDPEVPIKPLHKMTKKQILKEFPANGFELVEEYDKLPWQHVMFFQAAKPADGRKGEE